MTGPDTIPDGIVVKTTHEYEVEIEGHSNPLRITESETVGCLDLDFDSCTAYNLSAADLRRVAWACSRAADDLEASR